MSELQRYYQLANKLAVEEHHEPEVLPVIQSERVVRRGYYICRGCSKGFVDVASIRRHEAMYCHRLNTSPRESERPFSIQRMMGG